MYILRCNTPLRFATMVVGHQNLRGNMKRFSKVRFLAVQLLATASLLVGSLGMGVAAHAASTTASKPTPTVPANVQSALQQPDPTKESKRGLADQPRGLAAAAAWTVNLNASSTSLWPTQYTTLTATANQNVGPTAYYISIYDQTANSFVKICGSGTACGVSVTQNTATTHTFKAYVSYYPSSNPPSSIQATSINVAVTWKSVSVSLTASPTTLAINGNSTLTATTSADIGPSPFYTHIFDLTTGARVVVCGFGTSCTTTVSQSAATTHKYGAFVTNLTTTVPTTGIQAKSVPNFVTWANTGYRIALTSSRTAYGRETLTATSNVSVGPTAYYIQIFNVNTGARVAVCGSGTTCTATVSLSYGQNNFVAFTSGYSTALPPANTQASSAIRSTFFLPIL